MKDESGNAEGCAVMFAGVGLALFLVIMALIYGGTLLANGFGLIAFIALIAGIGLVLYNVFGPQQETVVIRGIDAKLRNVLAQIEGQEPITVFPALSTRSVDWQESVIRDTLCGNLTMRFVRDTEDGKIYTTVCLERERAFVKMVINNDNEPLEYLDYVSILNWRTPGLKESPESVRHVREWMRQRILPELEAAKTHRESEYMRLKIERDAKLEEEQRKLEEEQRKLEEERRNRERLRDKYLQ